MGAFATAFGRYPAPENQASASAATATVAARAETDRYSCPTSAKPRIAATGRNAAITQVPGPDPRASLPRWARSVVPTNEPIVEPPPARIVGTNGKSKIAAVRAATRRRPKPRNRAEPART